jgi:hypothetical protein
MSVRLPFVVALAGSAALAAPAAGASGPPVTEQPHPLAERHARDVVSARVFRDTHGAGKGTMLVRVKKRYRYAQARADERWFGVTTITVRGPGGRKVVRDTDRLIHPAAGQVVDHRVVLSRAEARRILGPRGNRAKVRITVRGHMEMRGAVRETGVAGTGGNGGAGGYGGDGGLGTVAIGGTGGNGGAGGTGLLGVTSTASYPPPAQSWGNYALFVYWTQTQPFRPYAGAFYVPGWQSPRWAALVLQPWYDSVGNPMSGLLGSDGTFQMTAGYQSNARWCPPAPPATVSGAVPTPGSTGAFPNQPATVSWQWSGLWVNCHESQSVGPTVIARDASTS